MARKDSRAYACKNEAFTQQHGQSKVFGSNHNLTGLNKGRGQRARVHVLAVAAEFFHRHHA